MQRIKSLILLGIFVLPVCASPVTYYLDITPGENSQIYQMNINESVTFQVKGFKKEEGSEQVSEVKIDKAWWKFDKETLVKVNSGQNFVTLKAKKSGVSELTAIGMVENYNCTQTITILIKDK